MKKNQVFIGIFLIIVIVILLFFGLRGCYYHPYHTISKVSSVSVDAMRFSKVRNKYADLMTKSDLEKINLPDSANVIAIELNPRNNFSGTSDQEILDRIDQLYYNKYDNFVSILTLLLSAFAIIIAFFGGYIPYTQSVKSSNVFNDMIKRLEKQEKDNIQLNEKTEALNTELHDIFSMHNDLLLKFTKLDEKYTKRIEKEKKRIEILRKRIPPIDMSTVFGEMEIAKELLEKHYQLTENLLMLGGELENMDYVLRSARCIYQSDPTLQDELNMWLSEDPDEYYLLIVAKAYDDKKNHNEAVKICDMVTAKNTKNELAWLIKAHSYSKMSDYLNVIKCYDELLRLNDKDYFSHYYLAVAYAYLNQKEKFLPHLKLALTNDKVFIEIAKTEPAFKQYPEVREMISDIEKKK
jgi:tetratricopeptide (TPR) repeat protein